MTREEFPWGDESLLGMRAGTWIALSLDDIWHTGAELKKLWDSLGVRWTPAIQLRAGKATYSRKIRLDKAHQRFFHKKGPFEALIKKLGVHDSFTCSPIYGDYKTTVVSPHLVMGAMCIAFSFDRSFRRHLRDGCPVSVVYHLPYAQTRWFDDSCALPFFMKPYVLEEVQKAIAERQPCRDAKDPRDELTWMLETIDDMSIILPTGTRPTSPKMKVTFSRPKGDNAKVFQAFFNAALEKRRSKIGELLAVETAAIAVMDACPDVWGQVPQEWRKKDKSKRGVGDKDGDSEDEEVSETDGEPEDDVDDAPKAKPIKKKPKVSVSAGGSRNTGAPTWKTAPS